MKPLYMHRGRMHGFNLVELMVALTIGLIILAAVSSLFVNSKQTYTTQDSLARLQENARFAMQFLTKDIRLGGYFGCLDNMYGASPGVAFAGGLTFATNATVPFEGVENASGAWAPSGSALPLGAALPAGMQPGTDAIAIRMADTSAWANVTPGMMNGWSDIFVDNVTPFAVNDIVVISDCASADITQISGITGAQLAHNTALPLQKAYAAPAARVYRIATRQYFVQPNANGIPALFRDGVELVEGIENLQILYGEDTDTPATELTDGVPNVYRTASAVVNWSKVVSVRIGILARTLDQKNTDIDNGTYDVDGDGTNEVTAPGDRFRRRIFQATVQLRNML